MLFFNKKHLFLPAIFLLFWLFATAQEQPYNVLFIAVDDMNCDLNCYGNEAVHSPNIDRLAQMGTRFERAYCQFPWCSPSRTSIMTGMRPTTTQVFDLTTHFRDIHPEVVTLGQLFKQNKYFVARVGKIYHYGNPGQIGTNGLDDSLTWHERYNPYGREKGEEDLLIDYTPQRGIGSSLNWQAADGRDEEQTDGKVATQTIQLMQEHHDEPFFIACGFYRPHCPFVAPKKYFDLYPLEGIQRPFEPENDLDDVPKAAQWTNPPYWGLEDEEIRNTIRAYYATISFVDAQVGRVLHTMDSLNLWDNTIVVFWSDHGYNLSHHQQWMKQSLFEQATRVPFIIVHPDQRKRGMASPRTVELLDIYPTLADLCSIKTPSTAEGVSLRPLLNDPFVEWNRPAYSQVWRWQGFPGYSVRTERWRYVEWGGGAKGVELYDHLEDPNEWHNLAEYPAYRPVVEKLQRLLRQQWPKDAWTPAK